MGMPHLLTTVLGATTLAWVQRKGAQKTEHKKSPKDTEPELTIREVEVLTWLARGKTEDEIAEQLNMSPHTVDYHKRNIRRKFDTDKTITAVAKASKMGMINL